MSLFDFLLRPLPPGASPQKRPGDVCCLDGHAVDYLCRLDFFVCVDPVAICGHRLRATGHARPGRPSCSACLAELARAAPLLAARLAWRGRTSTCGRWRTRRLRQPPDPAYPWVIDERAGRGWRLAEETWCPDEEAARGFAQELETKRVCEELRRERTTGHRPNERNTR